jgi:hypothetical protein
VFLFQFVEELFSRIAPPVPGKSCVEHDFRVHINCGVEPRVLFIFELNLFFIDSNAIWFSAEVLIVMLGICLVPVVDCGLASVDTKPLTEISTLGQRGGSSMGSVRQPDQPGWRARPVTIQKLHIRRIRYLYLEFFKEHVPTLIEELRSVQPQSSSTTSVCISELGTAL